MQALDEFNRHIRERELGLLLKPRVFPDGSSISPSDGSKNILVVQQNKPQGYVFHYSVLNRKITYEDGSSHPAGVEIDPRPYLADHTGTDVAKTGGTPAWKLALDAISRRGRMDRVTIRDAAARSDQDLQVIESVRQRAQARTVEKLSQAMTAAAQARPSEGGLDVLSAEDEAAGLGPAGSAARVPNPIDQSMPTDYSEIEKIKPEDLNWNQSWKLPNQTGLTVAGKGTKAELLVKSQAFQDMVGVKASRHAAVRLDEMDSVENGVGIVRYPVENGGDGSEIHYRLDPNPLIGQEGTKGAGMVVHRVRGFSVTVPHLREEPGAEHTYTRDQDVRSDFNDDGQPFGVVTHMTHQMARNDADGNTHWSEPLAHEVGEAGEDRYSDLTPRQEERIEAERSLSGVVLQDADYAIDNRRHEIMTGYKKDWKGRRVESLGGLREVRRRGSESMKFLLHRQVAAHYGPIPETMSDRDLANLLAEARSRGDVTDITRIKADLLQKHAELLHPDNVKTAKGFKIDPNMDQNTIRFHRYIDKHFQKTLGMARVFKSDPDAPQDRVAAAGDFLLDMFRQLPTVPRRSGGRNWLKMIRDDVAAKVNPKRPQLSVVKDREAPGRKQAEVVPHDAEIEQVHGVTLLGQHSDPKTRKSIPFERELNPEDHPEVFAAKTIGELHQAIHNIRTVNPHTTDVRVQNRPKPASKKVTDKRAWRTAPQPEPEPTAPEVGAKPHRSQIRVTLAGQAEPVAINSAPETGAPHTYRVDQGQASRVATVAWSIYHPHSGKVVMTPRNSVAVFSSKSKAIAHAQMLQREGGEMGQHGHVLVPLYKSTQKPIDTPIHPDYMPREAGVDIPMIGRFAVPNWVEGKTVHEIPWGEAGGSIHAHAVQRIKEERDASQRIGLFALKESLVNPNQMKVPEKHDSVLTRAPQDARGRVPLRAGFTPVP